MTKPQEVHVFSFLRETLLASVRCSSAPPFTRRGLGKRILEACEDAARGKQFTHVELMATLPGVPLYRAAGYVDREPFDVLLPDGVGLPCIRMGKAL